MEDHHLATREATDAFKAEHDVRTTSQVFIGGKRIGGHDDLRRFLGKRVIDPQATSYRPVIALFAMTALMAMAARSEEHTSELQSLMRISYAVFCLKQKILINLSTSHYLFSFPCSYLYF